MMGKIANPCPGTGQRAAIGPDGIGHQCAVCGKQMVPFLNGTMRLHVHVDTYDAPDRLRPCECGCGRLARGHHLAGHRPIKSYRKRGTKNLHVVRAEKALGHPLPAGAHVHHADGSMRDDAPLVICQDSRYHKLLHVRMRIVRAGGNPDTQALCHQCLTVKDVSEFYRYRKDHAIIPGCKSCKTAKRKRRWRIELLERKQNTGPETLEAPVS